MRLIGIAQNSHEYTQAPNSLEADEFLWLSCARSEFETRLAEIQDLLIRLDGKPLLDFHIQDLLSTQQPSHYDYTSYYDVIVFRRLAVCDSSASNADSDDCDQLTLDGSVATEPVGFVIFDNVLLTVHDDLLLRDLFASKLLDDNTASTGRLRRTGAHLPTSPDELMLRLVDFVVDGYTGLRRLTQQLDMWQTALLSVDTSPTNWQSLFKARNALQQLEDLCEDQGVAIKAWQESIEDEDSDIELLEVRARDVLEHIERSRAHVHRLQSALESAIQLHFSATANRTNHVMRTLTVLTAIFLPLNLLTGLFGMNFANMFLTKYSWGFWLVLLLMVGNTVFLVHYFWRKHYLD